MVATLAWFDLATGGLTWTGIGNVEGRLVRADRQHGDSDRLPHPVRRRARLVAARGAAGPDDAGPGDCVVMATDGVAADFGSSLQPGVPAPEQAQRVLESHSRGSDDALVVAVRWMPGA